MKTLVIGNLEALSYELANSIPAYEAITASKETLVPESFNMVIVHDKEIPVYELKGIAEQYEGAAVFYSISYDVRQAIIDNKIQACKDLNIVPLMPKWSILQQAENIIKYLNGELDLDREKRIVSFLGTHSQIGTTQTVLGVAAMLKELSNYSVVVLSLASSNPPSLYMQANGTTLNDLYSSFDNNRSMLKAEDMKSLLYEDEKGYFFLPGNQDYTKRNHYNIDDIEYLIDMLYSVFDIVLIDAGHDPDTNLTIQALMKADLKFVNTTQQPIGSMLWRKMNEDILGRHLNITPDEFLMIINKYSNEFPKRDVKILEQEMGVVEVARIPNLGNEGIMCEINKSLLYDLKHKPSRKLLHEAYRKLSMIILERLNLLDDQNEGQGAKTWPWNRKNA